MPNPSNKKGMSWFFWVSQNNFLASPKKEDRKGEKEDRPFNLQIVRQRISSKKKINGKKSAQCTHLNGIHFL